MCSLHVHRSHVWCRRRSEKGAGASRSGVKDVSCPVGAGNCVGIACVSSSLLLSELPLWPPVIRGLRLRFSCFGLLGSPLPLCSLPTSPETPRGGRLPRLQEPASPSPSTAQTAVTSLSQLLGLAGYRKMPRSASQELKAKVDFVPFNIGISSVPHVFKSSPQGPGKTAQQVRVPVTKPDNPSLIPGTHTAGGEN